MLIVPFSLHDSSSLHLAPPAIIRRVVLRWLQDRLKYFRCWSGIDGTRPRDSFEILSLKACASLSAGSRSLHVGWMTDPTSKPTSRMACRSRSASFQAIPWPSLFMPWMPMKLGSICCSNMSLWDRKTVNTRLMELTSGAPGAFAAFTAASISVRAA